MFKLNRYRTWINEKGYRILYKKYFGKISFCHYIWNLYNPRNKIVKNDNCLIHHKDGNKLNDDINNLEKLTYSKHMKIHKLGNKYNLRRFPSIETRRKLSKAKSEKSHPMYGKIGKLSPNYGSKRSLKNKRENERSLENKKK